MSTNIKIFGETIKILRPFQKVGLGIQIDWENNDCQKFYKAEESLSTVTQPFNAM